MIRRIFTILAALSAIVCCVLALAIIISAGTLYEFDPAAGWRVLLSGGDLSLIGPSFLLTIPLRGVAIPFAVCLALALLLLCERRARKQGFEVLPPDQRSVSR